MRYKETMSKEEIERIALRMSLPAGWTATTEPA
jgi:hypothetical protein